MLLLAKAQAERKKNLDLLLKSTPQESSSDDSENSTINISIKNNPDNNNKVGTATFTQTKTESSCAQDAQEEESQAAYPRIKTPYDTMMGNIAIAAPPVITLGFMIMGGAPIAMIANFNTLQMVILTGAALVANNQTPNVSSDQKNTQKDKV